MMFERKKAQGGASRKHQAAPLARSTTKSALSALRDSEARLRAILDTAVDGIVTIDERGVIESVNAAAERLFGYTAAELVGRNVSVLMPEPHREQHDAYIKRYMRTGEARILGIGREVPGRRKDGTVFPLDLAVSEFRLGGSRRFTGIVRDISDRKRLEEQFLHAQKMEGIGRLAGGVAHDFNNLLTAIIGYAELAADGLTPEHELQPYLTNIQRAAERASALTRQLLAFARKQPVEPTTIDLNDLVSDISGMLRRLIGDDIRLSTVLEPGLGTTVADPSQIEQVLVNLVVNARDAMPDGGTITVATANVTLDEEYARTHAEVTPGDYVLMAVSDTGVGMTAEVLRHAFEPFFTTKGSGKGTGLGLSMCYATVRQAGGHIWVYSEVGSGTTVKAYLPRASAGAPGAQSEAPGRPADGTETVLLVEDDPMVRETAVSALRAHGYRVLEAENGVAALEAAAAHPDVVDLVVTDMVMPSMGGKELVRRLSEQRPGLRVLYTSGHTDAAVTQNGWLDTGAEFLQKPFAPSALARKVRHVLDKTEGT